MKKTIYITTLFITYLFMSCSDDLLDKTPLDTISEPDFWKTESDLELYANSFYQDLPSWPGTSLGYAENPDNDTDISLYTLGNTTFPSNNYGSSWNWANVRQANYFISNMDKATGVEAELNHLKGEGYFFRAYYYYTLFRNFGDLPIYREYFDNENEEALFASRNPREEVADFMLEDLDKAISMLKEKSVISSQRISKEAALLLKATIALYEGTWEKYHAGTDFGVDGSTGTKYLEIAAEAAKELMDMGTLSLHSDYESIFNQTNLSSNNEIILWRQYDYLTYGNSYGNAAQVSWPNRSGYTRFAVRQYLCTDGKPISVSDLYKGDKGLDSLEVNRDARLAATIMVPGDKLIVNISGNTTLFTVPTIDGNNAAVTGYEGQKYRDIYQVTAGEYSRSTAKIVMRYAEALLIYAEAKAELGTITQNDLDISINLLRDRGGVAHLMLDNITTDPDWPNYGYTPSDIIYEIRRERTVELMGEGFRYDDFMRWRAHTLFDSESPKGAYYETNLYGALGTGLYLDSEGYLDPYQISNPTGYNFVETRDYLNAIPVTETTLNPNLGQNPGW